MMQQIQTHRSSSTRSIWLLALTFVCGGIAGFGVHALAIQGAAVEETSDWVLVSRPLYFPDDEQALTNDEVAFLKNFIRFHRRKYEPYFGRQQGLEALHLGTDADVKSILANKEYGHSGRITCFRQLLESLRKYDFQKTAEEVATTALDHGYEFYAIYYHRGMARMNLEKYDEAEDDFMAAIARFDLDSKDWHLYKPNPFDVYIALARNRYLNKDYPGMTEAYLKTTSSQNLFGPNQPNMLNGDWSRLTFSEKIRRIMTDLDIRPETIEPNMFTVFYPLLEAVHVGRSEQ